MGQQCSKTPKLLHDDSTRVQPVCWIRDRLSHDIHLIWLLCKCPCYSNVVGSPINFSLALPGEFNFNPHFLYWENSARVFYTLLCWHCRIPGVNARGSTRAPTFRPWSLSASLREPEDRIAPHCTMRPSREPAIDVEPLSALSATRMLTKVIDRWTVSMKATCCHDACMCRCPLVQPTNSTRLGHPFQQVLFFSIILPAVFHFCPDEVRRRQFP